MANENLFRDDMVGRFRDLERRIEALERQPPTFDLPFNMTSLQNLDSTARAVPVTANTPTWTACWWGLFPLCLFPAVYLEAHILTPAGTTAEVQLINFVSGGSLSSIYSVTAALDYRRTFKWLHEQTLGTGPFTPLLQVRRTSGAGIIQVFIPETPLLVTQQSVNYQGGYTTTG